MEDTLREALQKELARPLCPSTHWPQVSIYLPLPRASQGNQITMPGFALHLLL